MKLDTISLLLATLTTGLMAGLFYSWSYSVTVGLAKLNDISYLQAFQSMNRAILNPAFFAIFFGSVILLPVAAFLFIKPDYSLRFWLLVAATFIYLAGSFGVTFFGNVPLNNTLESLHIEKLTADEALGFRTGFEGKWNSLNFIRTFSSTISFLLLIIVCLMHANELTDG